MSGHYPIHGIPVSPGQSVPLRREFNDWAKDHQDNIQVSLLIRALRRFYQIPYTDTKSYFQVAGIHGYPSNFNWNNAPPPTYTREHEDTFPKHYIYCTHGLEIFPTWHRVYMLLFEQRIHELMLEVIHELHFNTNAEKQQWTAQAGLWRLPYWNWALPRAGVGIPELFKDKEIKIRAPLATNGTAKKPDEVENPLYRYELQVDGKVTKMGNLPEPFTIEDVLLSNPGITLPWSKCSGTSRWGIDNESEEKWSAGRNEWLKTNIAIQAHQYEDPHGGEPQRDINKHAVSDIIYRILTPGNLSTYKDFATTDGKPKNVKKWTDFLSLEYIHNNLHGFIGGEDLLFGAGHMQNVPVAAFDPVFWFHHANIDLYLAIWQTLNSAAWFDKASGELSPFYTNEDKLYTSNDVRTWTNLGYQYDVLERKTEEDDTAYVNRIKEYIDSFPHTGQALLQSPEQQKLESVIAGDDLYPDYLINIFYDRNALEGDPYTIHFFLGKVSDLEINSRTEIIAKHPKHVGSVYTFTARMNDATNERCGNCAQQAENSALSTAQIPVTIPLLKQACDPNDDGINKIDYDAVEHYLLRNLDWRAIDAVGQIIPANKLPKTKIFALKGSAKHYREPEMTSEYIKYEPMADVTDGKPIGASHGDYSSPSYGYD